MKNNTALEPVNVSICPLPFAFARDIVQVPSGTTLLEVIEQHAPRALEKDLYAIVSIDGMPVSREAWDSTKVYPMQIVTVRVAMGGHGENSGKNALAMVLAIGSAALGFWAGAALLKAGVSWWKIGLATGAIGAAGVYAQSKLVSVPMIEPPDYPPDDPVYSVTGTQNRMNLGGAIPRVYGKIRIFPSLGARPYTELAGDEQYIRLLFCPGYGPLKLENFQLDGIGLENYDAEVEVRQGYDDDTALELFSNTVLEERFNVYLDYNEWVADVSEDDADELSVDIEFPSGIVKIDPDQIKKITSVNFTIEYRQQGQQYLAYDNQTVNFLAGETLTGQTSNATAVILADADLGNYGYLRLWKVSGTFQNNEVIKDSQGTPGSADVNGTVGETLLTYDNEAGGPFSIGNTITGVTSGTTGTLRGLIDLGAAGFLIVEGADNYYEDNEQVGDGSTTADAAGDSLWSGPWLPNSNPDIESLCPGFDEWTLGGGASYNGGTGEVTLSSEGDYVESPYIEAFYAHTFYFQAQYYSSTASDEYTPAAGWWAEFSYWSSWGSGYSPHININGETETEEHDGFTTGSWQTETYEGAGGAPLVKIRIESKWPYTSASYKIKLPKFTLAMSLIVSGKTTRAVRRTHRFLVPSRGRYDMRIKRLTVVNGTASDGTQYIDASYWTKFRTIRWVDPINRTGMAKIALRLKATEQIQGSIDRFSVLTTSILPAWNGSSWDAAAETQNPAWALCDVLKGNANANPVTDSKLDLTAIKAWGDSCTTKGYLMGGVIDARQTVLRSCSAIAATGRASFGLQDTTYTVVSDHAAPTSIVQHFTPRNSWGFSGSKTFYEPPHCLLIDFWNEDENYEPDTREVYDDDYDEDNATRFETLKMWGVTDPDLIWKHGRYHLAEMLLRPEVYTLNSDVESIVCQRGDLVRVTHDIPLWGLDVGRITATSVDGVNLDVTLDEPVTMEAGSSYTMRVRTATLGSIAPVVETDAGTQTTVKLLLGAGQGIAADDLFQFGMYQSESVELIVHSVIAGPDLSATISFVDIADGVYTADSGTIPDHDSNITDPPDEYRRPPAPVIAQVRSDETVLYRGPDGTLESQILVEFSPVSAAEIVPTYVQGDYRETDSGERWHRLPDVSIDAFEFSIRPVEDGSTYDLRFRHVSEFGRTSDWTETEHTVIGKSTPPPDVTGITIDLPSMLRWSYPSPPPDLAGFRVRYNYGSDTAWATAANAHDGLIVQTAFDIGTFSGGTMTFMVKAVDVANNESENVAYVVKDLGDPPIENIITTWDIKAARWPGFHMNSLFAGGDLEARDRSLFWPENGDQQFWNDNGAAIFWTASEYRELRYLFEYDPIAADVPSTLSLDYTIAALKDIRYRYNTSVEEDTFTRSPPLGADWTGTGGTWTIGTGGHANQCEGVSSSTDARCIWKTTLTLGQEYFCKSEIKTDVDDTGWYILGHRITRHTNKWQFDGVDTDEQPAFMQLIYIWVQEDGTVEIYGGAVVHGGFITSFAWDGNDGDIGFCITANAVTNWWDDFELRVPADSWQLWPGMIDTRDELIEFMIRTHSGTTKGNLTKLELELDVPDIRETGKDFAVAYSGTIRLPITETYRSIVYVSLTIASSGAETAVSAKVHDYSTSGPEIRCYDSGANRVAGHVNWEVGGY